MSDASPPSASGAAETAVKQEVAKPEEPKPATEEKSEVARSDEAKPAEGASEAAKAEAEPAKPAEVVTSDDKAETRPAEIVTGEVKSSPASVSANAEPSATEPKAEPVKAVEPKPAEPATAAAAKPAENVASEAPAKKDVSRLPGVEKAKPELKREGQVAVFISGKDGKLYVRQNFKPVFDVPVTIAPGDKLLGTHVFTAEIDKNDPNALRWSVVSLPVTARNAQRIDQDERATRRRKVAGSVPPAVKPVPMPNASGPGEALDRITLPPDVMAKIAEALATGGSIVVSDQSIKQGETGEGTDFIVRLR
jgi:hypothetical protein